MSSGFCKDPRANIQLTGQNGAEYNTTPKVGAKCPGKSKGTKKGKGAKASIKAPFAGLSSAW